jgi:8-oxo-dGTP pyrophosphatase MutT (NUDIX family)
MPVLTEIFRDKDAAIHGKTVHRVAVRAVVLRDNHLLMVYSPVNGDYKFPGGGVEENEKLENALQREVIEECGARLTKVIREIGSIVEFANAKEPEFETFKMTSHYFLCEVDAFVMSQELDDYEVELKFQPVWVEIATALQTNKSRLEQPNPPRWTARDTFMLEYLKTHLL